MFAQSADIYAPDDATPGQRVTSQADQPAQTRYSFSTPNVLIGVIGLAALALWANHNLGRRKR